MSILDTLAHDHRTVQAMLEELGVTPSSDANARIELFSKLQALLVAHARAEEEVVYRRLREREPEEALLLEAYAEHHIADVLLQELASACPGGPAWAAKVKVLDEMLRLHIKAEETDLFPFVTADFDERTQHAMDAEFRALKHERLEQLLGPLRRATPAFAGRASITAQAAAGRFVRRGELYMRRRLGRVGT